MCRLSVNNPTNSPGGNRFMFSDPGPELEGRTSWDVDTQREYENYIERSAIHDTAPILSPAPALRKEKLLDDGNHHQKGRGESEGESIRKSKIITLNMVVIWW